MCSILLYVCIVSTQHELILSIYNLDLSREHKLECMTKIFVYIYYMEQYQRIIPAKCGMGELA